MSGFGSGCEIWAGKLPGLNIGRTVCFCIISFPNEINPITPKNLQVK